MLHISFLFMGNLRFSFLQHDKPRVVETGYLPLLEMLRKYPEVRSHVHSSGFTTRWLQEHAPAVIGQIRDGVREGRLRIGTNGFEHGYLPTFPLFAMEKLIAKGVEIDRTVYGQAPTGFWPSDGCWDPTVVKPLRDNGVAWVFNGFEVIKWAAPGGPYHVDWREIDPFWPVRLRGPEETEITNVHCAMSTNYDILLGRDRERYDRLFGMFRERAESGRDGLYIFGFDLEILTVLGGPRYRDPDNKPFGRFIEEILSLKNVRFSTVDEFLAGHPPEKSVFLREVWNPYGWDSGYRKLTDICRQAGDYLLAVEDLLAARPSLANESVRGRLETLWERYLFSMQSEARMTGAPHMWDQTTASGSEQTPSGVIYPPDALRMAAFDDAIAALRGARALKQELLRPSELRA